MLARPLVTVLLGTPPIAWLVLAMLWFGMSDGTPVFTVFIACFPVVFASALQGTRTLDQRPELKRLRLGHQLRRRGLLKFQQEVRGLDLDPLARIELDLGRAFSFGQDATGHEFAGFFKQCVHGRHSPMGAAVRIIGAPGPAQVCGAVQPTHQGAKVCRF